MSSEQVGRLAIQMMERGSSNGQLTLLNPTAWSVEAQNFFASLDVIAKVSAQFELYNSAYKG